VVEFFRSGQEEIKQGRVREEKFGFAMTFTGNLIESLMATVERAELSSEPRAQADETLFAEHMVVEPWFASVQDNADYDSNFIGVA
jgi:hypothetical protein